MSATDQRTFACECGFTFRAECRPELCPDCHERMAPTCDECGTTLDPELDHDSKEGGLCAACARGEGREWARAQAEHPNVRG